MQIKNNPNKAGVSPSTPEGKYTLLFLTYQDRYTPEEAQRIFSKFFSFFKRFNFLYYKKRSWKFKDAFSPNNFFLNSFC